MDLFPTSPPLAASIGGRSHWVWNHDDNPSGFQLSAGLLYCQREFGIGGQYTGKQAESLLRGDHTRRLRLTID